MQKLYDGKQSDNSWKMPIENICVFSTKVEWFTLSLTRERRDPHEPLRLRTTKNGVFRAGLSGTAPAQHNEAPAYPKRADRKHTFRNICVFSMKVGLVTLARRRERCDPHEPPCLRTTFAGVHANRYKDLLYIGIVLRDTNRAAQVRRRSDPPASSRHPATWGDLERSGTSWTIWDFCSENDGPMKGFLKEWSHVVYHKLDKGMFC